jgi:acyl-CoA synthetase (AMP-forming)/AMP-acid ligase II
VVTSSVGAPSVYGSVGRVLGGIEMRIVDSEGGDALVGDAGEIWVRGPNVFAGYLDDPEATARVLTPDGWLRTGDGGHLDDDGYLFLTDRVKDLIISGGENVYPAEVEAVLRTHPGVADAAVFGLPDERWGEVVAAAVVARTPLPAEDLIAFTDGLLAGYKRPRTIRFVDELPRNAAGKVLRRVLRDGALEGSPA